MMWIPLEGRAGIPRDESPARYTMWWEHDGWRVVAHEPLWPDGPGIPVISVQFDNLKLRKRSPLPKPPVKIDEIWDQPRELELA
jgi:hypothetical protein